MKILTKITIFFTWLVIGIVIGLTIRHIHYLTLNTEVGFGDIANFVLALVVAVVIPIMLNPWLDGERHIKDFLIDDIKDCLEELKQIKIKIDSCNTKGVTEKRDKQEILSKISYHDLKINSLINQLATTFKRQSGGMREKLYSESREYWQEVTGGALMNEDFKIDGSFCKNHDKAFLRLEGYLKNCICQINKF